MLINYLINKQSHKLITTQIPNQPQKLIKLILNRPINLININHIQQTLKDTRVPNLINNQHKLNPAIKIIIIINLKKITKTNIFLMKEVTNLNILKIQIFLIINHLTLPQIQ